MTESSSTTAQPQAQVSFVQSIPNPTSASVNVRDWVKDDPPGCSPSFHPDS